MSHNNDWFQVWRKEWYKKSGDGKTGRIERYKRRFPPKTAEKSDEMKVRRNLGRLLTARHLVS